MPSCCGRWADRQIKAGPPFDPTNLRRVSRRRGWTQFEGIVQTMGCFAVNAILAAVFVPNVLRARAHEQWRNCHSNLKSIATAVETYAGDHQGQYPVRLARLRPKYLKEMPTCPAAGTDCYTPSYACTTDPDNFSFSCSGRHHTPEGDPGYNGFEGILQGPPPQRGHNSTPIDALMSFVLAVGSVWTLLANIAMCWPEPLPESQELLQAHPRLSRANWLAWPTLCLLFAGLIAWALPFESRLGRFCVGAFVGPFFAQLLVKLGGGLWRRLSPPAAAGPAAEVQAGALPRLHDPVLVEVVPGGRQRLLAQWFTWGVPWFTVLLCIGLPALGSDPAAALRGSLLGLAAGLFLLFPAYRWGQHWSRELFQQQLEWIPGSGELVLHSRRWGWPRSQSLGTQADVQSLQQVRPGLYRLQVADYPLLLPAGRWLDRLREHLPSDEP